MKQIVRIFGIPRRAHKLFRLVVGGDSIRCRIPPQLYWQKTSHPHYLGAQAERLDLSIACDSAPPPLSNQPLSLGERRCLVLALEVQPFRMGKPVGTLLLLLLILFGVVLL